MSEETEAGLSEPIVRVLIAQGFRDAKTRVRSEALKMTGDLLRAFVVGSARLYSA